MHLFADDTIIYHQIKSVKDQEVLQQDLTALKAWKQEWQMEFHPDKCQVMRVGDSRVTKAAGI